MDHHLKKSKKSRNKYANHSKANDLLSAMALKVGSGRGFKNLRRGSKNLRWGFKNLRRGSKN
jgi:hypothetical protein